MATDLIPVTAAKGCRQGLSGASLEDVAEIGGELEAVLLEAGGWVVDEIVGRAEVDGEAMEGGEGEIEVAVGGVGIGVVPGGEDAAGFGEQELAGQVAAVGLGEGGADDVLVLRGDGGVELLLEVVEVEFEIELLSGALERGPAGTTDAIGGRRIGLSCWGAACAVARVAKMHAESNIGR